LIKENRKQDLGVIVSTHLTNEDLFAVRKFFGDTFGFENVDSHLSGMQPRMQYSNRF